MLKEQLESLKKVDTSMVACAMGDSLRDITESYSYHEKSVALAIILLKIQELNNPLINKAELIDSSILEGELRDTIIKYIEDIWDVVKDNLFKFTNEQLKSFILFDNSFCTGKSGGIVPTPDSVSRLACEILSIKDNEKLLELCSGQGSFAIQSFVSNPNLIYEGVELNYVARDIAIMRLSLIYDNFRIELHNALEYKSEDKADKLFSNYPFMLRSPTLNMCKVKLANSFNLSAETIQRISSDWLFNLIMIDQMKDDGKAVGIMTNGSTWNTFDRNIRKFFVDNGFVEAVISLPSKMFMDTSIPTTMIVLSRNNHSVRMIDATNICVSTRRNNEFTDADIEKIVGMLACDSDVSLLIDKEELADNDYVLYASRYLNKISEVENGIEFEGIIKNITRGSQLKASEFDELKSDSITPYQYLTLANVDNGIIDIGDNQYLTDMPRKLEKYCVKNNSIVLSKIGVPNFKSAVVSVSNDKKLLANGNLFVIELDETKADPYYIQAYFSSEAGIAAFKNIYAGVSLATISLDKIKKMIIPLPSMERQKDIGAKYAACIDEVVLLRRKLDKVTNRMNHLFDEEE